MNEKLKLQRMILSLRIFFFEKVHAVYLVCWKNVDNTVTDKNKTRLNRKKYSTFCIIKNVEEILQT